MRWRSRQIIAYFRHPPMALLIASQKTSTMTNGPMAGIAQYTRSPKIFLLAFLTLVFCTKAFSQNDNCSNASPVVIPAGGFALGTFTSSIYDISAATVEPGETFAPAIFVA